MIKMGAVAICDICGQTQPAKAVPGQYNEPGYIIPDGWVTSQVNHSVHLCPVCAKKLKEVHHRG